MDYDDMISMLNRQTGAESPDADRLLNNDLDIFANLEFSFLEDSTLLNNNNNIMDCNQNNLQNNEIQKSSSKFKAIAQSSIKPQPSTLKNESISESLKISIAEDKRKRNSEASARFRKKKKQQETEYERKILELSQKLEDMESKINLLQVENNLLKQLLLSKQ